MVYLRIAIGILILCTAIYRKTYSFEETNFVRDFSITTPNSTIVPLGDHLYSVFKNSSHVRINSTNADYKTCTITVDPIEDMIRSTARVEVAFDREIFVWGIRSLEINDNIASIGYAVLWINPWECSYKSISILNSHDAKIPYYPFLQLIRYRGNNRRAFDIFSPGLQTCNPCRFSDRAIKQDAYFRLHSVAGTSSRNFFIRWLEPDYFYVHNLDNGTAILQYLGEDHFDAIKQRYVDNIVEAVAVKKGNIRNVGICTRRDNNRVQDRRLRKEILCERLNLKLQTVTSISILVSENDCSIVSLEFDDQGNTYISFADDEELHVYIHDFDGELLHDYHLGPYTYLYYPYIRVYGFLVGKQYCVVVDRLSHNFTETLDDLRCIGVEKYFNKSKF